MEAEEQEQEEEEGEEEVEVDVGTETEVEMGVKVDGRTKARLYLELVSPPPLSLVALLWGWLRSMPSA